MIYAAVAIVILLVFFLAYSFWPERSREFGRFEGRIVSHWDDGGRNMTLLEDFAYTAPTQQRWFAPKGSVVNGASIPQAFWSIIGGPFEGRYRNASVIHDVACNDMKESWEAVHRMFYDACRCGGVGEQKAKLLYYAVYNYGPRWTIAVRTKGLQPEVAVPRAMRSPTREPGEDEVRKALAYFKEHNPPTDAIPALRLEE